MDFSVMSIGDVQNVLSAMQKNLECAICLDVVKEPVSTKCDHVFCRFCIFKLFREKKKCVVECPLCKTEVTKRSLKENSRFKQLIEALLETMHAFELDTGVKILNSHDLPKTSTEATAADLLHKERSVVQSKGFRNRKKGTKGNGQETCTLQEAKVDTQPADTRVKQCPLRNKTQKCDPEKGLCIEFGSDSSEELFKQQSNARPEDKAGLHISSQEQTIAEEGKGCCLNAQPDKLAAKGGILPNIPGESDFSKEGLSKRSTRSTTECAKPVQVNVTGCQSSPLSVAVELLTEQCDRAGPESPQRGDTSSFQNTEAADAEQTWCSSKSKEFDLKDSSESSLDESKELDSVVKIVEMYKPENDSFCENELTLKKLLQPEMLHCTALVEVSRKRLKRSIEKVNEWFSKSNEFLTSGSSQDNSAGAAVLDSGDVCLSDRDSCISEKTDPMEIAMDEGKRESRPTAGSIKDKIFGKTYERERKSTPLTIWRDVLPSTKQEDVGSAEKCLNDSSKDRLKRKRKTVCVLQPEDFIKQKDKEWADGSPQSVNCCFGGAEEQRHDERSAVNESHLSENKEGNAVAALDEGGGSIQKKATAKVTGKHCDRELELNKSDQKSTKKSTAAKRCRSSTRAMCALQLVLDRNSLSPDPAEPQIDSYPSSEEARKVDCEQRQVRCSRRLRLLSGEMTKEMGRAAVVKGARTSGSDGEEPFGVQSNVLVHTSECKDLCEPQGVLSHKLLTDLQADKMRVSLKNSPDAADAGRSLFNPPAMCQHSNCSSSAPDAGAQGDEIQGSPFLLQSPSVTGVQTPDPAEEVTESCIPQSSGHDIQSVPEDLKTEKLPVAKAAWDLTKEAADSELDTQCLRGIFRQSKRLSFSFYPALTQVCAAEGAAAETLKVLCADQIENEHSKHLNTENFQEEKAAENLSRICEKEELKTCDSVCVIPVTCFVGNTESMGTGEREDDVSQFANQETLTPVRVGAARIEDKNRLQKGEQGGEKAVSAAVGIGGELRQNAVRSPSSQSDQSNAAELPYSTAAVKTAKETCFSSGSNQAHKAKVVDSKGPVLHSQSRSMISAAPEQRPAECRGEAIEKKCSKREQKPVKGNKGEAAQTGGTGLPECLVPEAPEELLKGNGGFTHLSETADGLLCCDDDTEENSSFSETDRREKSAVFVRGSDCALMKKVHNGNAGSGMSSRGIQRSRRRVQKLPSSDEESSEGEDLPCFQTFIFGKSVSTPLQVNKQVASVAEASVSPSMSLHDGSHDDSNVQKLPEAAPGNGCLSLSQESECSINLFSSQSNNSEESAGGAQELKKLSSQADRYKQVNNESKSKEMSQSCNGRLKRSKTNFKDESQEDPNVGANLASGYDSETSNVEDSCGLLSQGEILTTQQKNAMQHNLKKLQEEMAVLEAVLQQHGSQDSEFPPVHRELPCSSSKGTFGMEQRRQERENADEQKSGTRLDSPSVVSNLPGNVTGSPSNSPSSAKLLHPVTAAAAAAKSSATALLSTLSCTQEGESKSSVCFPLPVLHSAAGKECAAVTNRKAMSIVASGLKQSERLVVQKFARKTRSTLSNHITEGTTHVIMKTDKELVCERTLKYFLGIAGRKWVVSYQWVIQSFKEGRILDEENFEVRGDVINGRNHQGPKRARESLTEKIFKDFEICCCGPFTGMTTEHLEWMVELCGASVVKQLHLFTHTTNSAVVVVQPDAWMENTDYRAIQQKNSIAMVTREWVLDSVACYECQELDAYLVS